MKVIIKHRSRGRVRVQMAQRRMSLEQADLLEGYLQGLPQVTRVCVHERTCCAVVEYRGTLKDLLRALERFSYQMEGLRPPISSSRALNREYEEKLAAMVAAKAASVLFSPPRSGSPIPSGNRFPICSGESGVSCGGGCTWRCWTPFPLEYP